MGGLGPVNINWWQSNHRFEIKTIKATFFSTVNLQEKWILEIFMQSLYCLQPLNKNQQPIVTLNSSENKPEQQTSLLFPKFIKSIRINSLHSNASTIYKDEIIPMRESRVFPTSHGGFCAWGWPKLFGGSNTLGGSEPPQPRNFGR